MGSLFDALISANGEHITYYCCDFLSQVTCTFLIFLESPKMKFEFFLNALVFLILYIQLLSWTKMNCKHLSRALEILTNIYVKYGPKNL